MVEETLYTWCIQREKGCKLIIRKVYEQNIKYCFNRIPLTNEQMNSIAKYFGTSIDSLDGRMFELEKEPDSYLGLLKSFFTTIKRIKAEQPDRFDYSVSGKHVLSNVQGTSKLIRSKNKQDIYVAKRTGKTPYSYANVIMIDDITRERFFKAAKSVYGDVKTLTDVGGGHKRPEYALHYGDKLFQEWSDFMDSEYARQSMLAKSDKD